MTSPNDSPYSDSYPWAVALAIGLVTSVIGLLLLFNLTAAVATLAVLVSFALIIGGAAELFLAEKRSAWDWIIAIVLAGGGIISLFWPDITLWALAVVTGVSLLIAGVARIAISVSERRDIPGWGLKLAGGGVSLVIGILALAWPAATVYVLAFLLGIRMLFSGLASLAVARALHAQGESSGSVW